MSKSLAFVVVVFAVAVLPPVYGYHYGPVSYESGVLVLLGSIAVSVAFIAGKVSDACQATNRTEQTGDDLRQRGPHASDLDDIGHIPTE